MLIIISFYIFSALFIQLKSFKVEVIVNEGIIFGVRQVTVYEQKWFYAFYGVPYAKAPLGSRRFQNPKPLKKFKKSLDATTEYHGACAQAHIVHKHALYGYEDCLHLNIYTPFLPNHKNQNLNPVVVWIHGYAFTSSFSHIYGPDFLIEHDIVFISLTHRIGIFGFLKQNISDHHTDMGLRDIITGLKWIRKNIIHFGGDKEKITLMCSGSGGTFASLLLLTKYRKLFQKLIIQSGSMFSPSLYQISNTLQTAKLQKEIKKTGYKDYMTAPANVLVTVSNKIYSTADVINFQRPVIPFSPLIKKGQKIKSVITPSHFDEYESTKSDIFNIPILIGFTTQESMSEALPFIHNPSHLRSFGSYFKYMVPFSNGCSYNYTSKMYASIADKIKRKYFKKHPNISIEQFLKYTSDLHKYPIYKFIKTHLMHTNRKMFVYKFNYDGKFNVMKSTTLAGKKTRIKGAAQGDESCYIMKCEPLWEYYVTLKNDIYNRDRIFMKQITTMWANFIKFGNPTPPNYGGNITWLPMTSDEDNLLLLQKRSKLTDTKMEGRMYEFWNKLYSDYYSPEHCKTTHDEL